MPKAGCLRPKRVGELDPWILIETQVGRFAGVWPTFLIPTPCSVAERATSADATIDRVSWGSEPKQEQLGNVPLP